MSKLSVGTTIYSNDTASTLIEDRGDDTLDDRGVLLEQAHFNSSPSKSWRETLRSISTLGSRPTGNPWLPTFARFGPLLGIGALLFVLLSIPASAIVLAVSTRQPVQKWAIQPSVYLSVVTGIGNKALGFAAIQGAIITWWLRALRGTTLEKLHYDWPVGTQVRRRKPLACTRVYSVARSQFNLDDAVAIAY